MKRSIADLTPEEVLRLAIQVEDRNEKIYKEFAEIFHDYDPRACAVFLEMASEEHDHGKKLREFYGRRYNRLPDEAFPVDVIEPGEAPMVADAEAMIHDSMTPQAAFEIAKKAERLAQEFYEAQARQARDPQFRTVCQELAAIEAEHLKEAQEKERRYREGKA